MTRASIAPMSACWNAANATPRFTSFSPSLRPLEFLLVN